MSVVKPPPGFGPAPGQQFSGHLIEAIHHPHYPPQGQIPAGAPETPPQEFYHNPHYALQPPGWSTADSPGGAFDWSTAGGATTTFSRTTPPPQAVWGPGPGVGSGFGVPSGEFIPGGFIPGGFIPGTPAGGVSWGGPAHPADLTPQGYSSQGQEIPSEYSEAVPTELQRGTSDLSIEEDHEDPEGEEDEEGEFNKLMEMLMVGGDDKKPRRERVRKRGKGRRNRRLAAEAETAAAAVAAAAAAATALRGVAPPTPLPAQPQAALSPRKSQVQSPTRAQAVPMGDVGVVNLGVVNLGAVPLGPPQGSPQGPVEAQAASGSFLEASGSGGAVPERRPRLASVAASPRRMAEAEEASRGGGVGGGAGSGTSPVRLPGAVRRTTGLVPIPTWRSPEAQEAAVRTAAVAKPGGLPCAPLLRNDAAAAAAAAVTAATAKRAPEPFGRRGSLENKNNAVAAAAPAGRTVTEAVCRRPEPAAAAAAAALVAPARVHHANVAVAAPQQVNIAAPASEDSWLVDQFVCPITQVNKT